MPSSKRVQLLVPVLVLVAAATAQAGTWKIDPNHSAAQFSVRHMVISNVKGAFTKMSGTVEYDPKDLSKTVVEATIDAASVDTRVEARDNDLRSPNFFDVQKYPTITFKSKRVEAAGSDKLKVIGDLTMHGVSKEVTLDVEGPTAAIKDPRGNLHMGVSATTKINRKDFGLTWSRVVEGAPMVSDDVLITLDMELVQAAETK